MTPNVWHPLTGNVPGVTGTGAVVISAIAVPGHSHVMVIGDQKDGKYSVERLIPVRHADENVEWREASHVYELGLQEALEYVQRKVLTAFSVAVQLSDIEERMAASKP